ncbi:MAG TPA: hypothetical protein VHL53_17750 [Acidimicrobiia bacterium]|nr:hypothetical protein [Acidimicrobiia bacterium]
MQVAVGVEESPFDQPGPVGERPGPFVCCGFDPLDADVELLEVGDVCGDQPPGQVAGVERFAVAEVPEEFDGASFDDVVEPAPQRCEICSSVEIRA